MQRSCKQFIASSSAANSKFDFFEQLYLEAGQMNNDPRAILARAKAVKQLESKRAESNYHKTTNMVEPVITPHGGPSVDYIPLKQWTTIAQ